MMERKLLFRHFIFNRRLPKGNLSLTGFTLIEILIAIGIFLVVVTLISTLFRNALLSWVESQVLARSYQSLKRIFLIIPEELSSSLKIDDSLINQKVDIFKGDKHFLFFIYPTKEGLKEIGYIYIPQTNSLVRRQSKCDFDFDTFDKEQELGVNIEDLNFSFFDGEKWQENLNTIPWAVKINLTLSYKDFRANYHQTINIPVGR